MKFFIEFRVSPNDIVIEQIGGKFTGRALVLLENEIEA